MYGRVHQALGKYLRNNLLLYALIILFFITGIVFGALGVRTLNVKQELELVTYVDRFLFTIDPASLSSQLIAQHAITNNLKLILTIWFLGLTVIGIPIIIGLVFTRGFVLGFTVGFLVYQKMWSGVVLTLTAILPQNLLNIPTLVVAGVTAVSFSTYLVRGRFQPGAVALWGQFINYSLLMLMLCLVAGLAGIIEAYISPLAIKLVTVYFP